MSTGGFGDSDFGDEAFGGLAAEEDDEVPADPEVGPDDPGTGPPERPAGPFADWWARIQARLGQTFAGDPLKYFADHEGGSYKNSRPPAIWFELGDDTYGTEGMGSRRGPASTLPDTLFLADTTILFHVWGKHPDHTHELRRALIDAIHVVGGGGGSYRLRGGTWNTGGVQSNGSDYVLTAVLKIPITRNPEARVSPIYLQDDYGIVKPGDDTQ